MFNTLKKHKEKVALAGAVALALATSAITYSGGQVTFEAGDSAAIDSGVGNGLGNLWAGVEFIAPYVGTFVGVALVFGGIMKLIQMRGSR